MAKGAEFELKARAYLVKLFDRLGLPVSEGRVQAAGTQNGFDIRIGFLDNAGRERKLYFECKDYTSPLSWDRIAVKVFELHASSHQPDGFIALSPHVDLSNGTINELEKLQYTIQAPVRCWSPESCVQEFFSLDATFYEEVYGEKPGPEYNDSDAILEKLRVIVKDMMRRKDELVKQPPVAFSPKELTLKIPRVDPGNVIGRDDELSEVHRLLFGSNNQVVVVNGMGGIGKTTLAQAYVSKYFEEYAHIAWITQVTGDVTTDIASAAGLAQNLRINTEGKNADQLFQEILLGMKSLPDGPSLLILDNVEEKLGKWKDYLPGKHQWHLLATSRQHIEGFYSKELDFLSPENAVALFKKHCSLIKDDTTIAKLVAEVDCHTLTIEILAKTAQLRRVSVSMLRDAIKEDLRTSVYIEHKGEKIEKVRSYLSSIFNFSGLDEMQQWLMKQFVCLPTEFHSYGLLLELIDPAEEKLAVFPETCTRLVEQGWLLYDTDVDAYKMHVIVQEVAKRQLTPAMRDVERLLETITGKLKIDQTKDNPIDKFKWIPFGYALLNALSLDEALEIGKLQNNLAAVLRNLGDYVGAKELLEKSITSGERHLGPDHPIIAVHYSNLALVLKNLGDYAGAKELLEKAVVLDERSHGLDDPTTARRYSNLAMVLQDLGDYAGATQLLQKAVASHERHFGPDHPVTAIDYSNQAQLLRYLGEYVRARELSEKALASAERHFGQDHPTTAIRYSNLALLLSDLGEYGKALALLTQSLAIFKKVFPAGHPYISQAQENYDHVKKASLGTGA